MCNHSEPLSGAVHEESSVPGDGRGRGIYEMPPGVIDTRLRQPHRHCRTRNVSVTPPLPDMECLCHTATAGPGMSLSIVGEW